MQLKVTRMVFFLILIQYLQGDTRKTKIIHMDVSKARYAFLVDVEESMNKIEKRLKTIIPRMKEDMRIGEGRETDRREHNEENTTFTGKAKGFSKRKCVGTAENCYQDVTGMCLSRQHRGVFYIVEAASDIGNVQERSQVYVLDARTISLVSTIILDAPNIDWEDIACGPCDSQGFGHCIYIADTGDGRNGPVNVIYKVQEPEELVKGERISLGEEEIEVIAFESPLMDSQTLLVSPRGRLFILSSRTKRIGVFEVVDDELKYLFDVVIPERYKHLGPYGGDISSDGKHFLIKFRDSVFYWYVDKEDDMEAVLTDPKQAKQLPYFEEENGRSIAWHPDGTSYLTLSQGCNEVLYRYDRLDDVGTEDEDADDDYYLNV